MSSAQSAANRRVPGRESPGAGNERGERRFGVLTASPGVVGNAKSFGQYGVLRLVLAALWCEALSAAPRPGLEADVRRDATVEAVERVMPSVVNIATATIVEYNDPFGQMLREFWGPYYQRRQPNTQYSLGSGVIIDENGYVLTNLHVVRRAGAIRVTLADGREFEAKPIVGNTRRDVALLKLITRGVEKFKAVSFAMDDDLFLGETVLALGNPFGLGGSVSRGILSSKNRRPPLETEPLDVADWLQTDAAINPGSSGGPLLNLRGELIGLNVAIYRQGHGIGFAIPIKQVTEALSEIFIPEVTQSAWFGARIKSGPYPLAVAEVEPESPAAKAGLQKGDVIAQVNGRRPKDFIQCTELISASPNLEVTLTVQRNGERRNIGARMIPLAQLVRQKLGASVQELDQDQLAEKLGFRRGEGLLVADVEQGGPAERADLQRGSLITAMDGQGTPDLLSAAGALARKRKGERVELLVVTRRQRGAFLQTRQGSVTVRVR
ncbi:MAG: PDZ domain-containing protein [Verrucomicrobia bacterium]|nr:MAG: PDZ domain-containing protein [Verrucomicrobiota bacterium]